MKKKRFEVLVDLMKRGGYHTLAEIGVREGETTCEVLNNCFIRQYFLVDPKIDESLYDELYGHPVSFMQMKSVEAVKYIADGCLDLVFIDGDHSYESCKADILLWAPKVHKGGIICGHDYKNPAHRGVEKAVTEIIGNVNYDEDCYFYWWKR